MKNMNCNINVVVNNATLLPGGGFYGGEPKETLPGGGFHGDRGKHLLDGRTPG